MKELAGMKLTLKDPSMKYGLIFWTMDELSQSIQFNDEKKCDEILNDIKEGKGVELYYNFCERSVRVFPHRVLRIKFTDEYSINFKDLPEIPESMTPEIKFPGDGYFVGLNRHQARLAEEAN
jgi:hypothetical protein